jgi:hypothetical protein
MNHKRSLWNQPLFEVCCAIHSCITYLSSTSGRIFVYLFPAMRTGFFRSQENVG